MTCVCGKDATMQHLRDNPECDKAIASLCALRSVSKRVSPGTNGGRKPVLVKCPKCGIEDSTGAMKTHTCAPPISRKTHRRKV